MSYNITGIILISSLTYCLPSVAEESYRPTMILGKQNTNISDYGKTRGMTFMMRVENASPWSVIGKLTATKNSWENEPDGCRRGDTQCQRRQREHVHEKRNAEYFSALTGPAYRLTRQVSVFGLAGYAFSVVDNPLKEYNNRLGKFTYIPQTSGQFAYSLGILFEPIDDLSLMVGHEVSTTLFSEKERSSGSNFLALGYSFK